ncbi:hypothetical protein CGMCC3_g12093 [Colletotrichum fructicola]|nr:uncharacterized protein CGMCC3_g12093 [Colletotrichum fructicola]KAE9571806.1 hypothetical protein CGMCC3_g12093 [Colletotrichum fructicola]
MLHTEVPATKDQTPYYQASERFNKAVLLGPKEDCATESCKAVGYTGSQDLCGISTLAQLMTSWSADVCEQVVVSYSLEAILVTMYLVVFTIHQVTQQSNNSSTDNQRTRTLSTM